MAETVIDIIIKATDQTAKALSAPIQDLQDLQGALQGAMPLWGAAAAAYGAAMVEMGKASLDMGEQADKASEETGMTAEQYTTLAFAAGETGVSTEGLGKVFKTFGQAITGAANGTAKYTDDFKALGISVTDANGKIKPTSELLNEVADAFQKSTDGAAKSKIAVDLFGKAGLSMIPMLDEGSAGMAKMAEKADLLGEVMGGKQAQASREFNETLFDLKAGAQGIVNVFMGQMLPTLQVVGDDFLVMVEKGGIVYEIFTQINDVIVDAAKRIATAFQLINSWVQISGTVWATFGIAVYDVIHGHFSQAVADVRDGAADIVKITQDATGKINTIWNGSVAGPKVDVNGTKKDLDAEYAASVATEAKQKALKKQSLADAQADNEQYIKSYKDASVAEIQAELATYDAVGTLHGQELKNFYALKDEEKAAQKRLEQAVTKSAKKMTMDQVDAALEALPPLVDCDAQQLASYKSLTTQKAELAKNQKTTEETLASDLISLSNSSNKTLAGIAKAASSAKALMATYTAATNALADFPFPISIAMAAAVTAAGMVQVAKIEGISGFEQGGIVGGDSYSGDNVLAAVNSGELIMNRAQQSSLAGQLQGSNQEMELAVSVDGQPFWKFLMKGLQSGKFYVPASCVRAG